MLQERREKGKEKMVRLITVRSPSFSISLSLASLCFALFFFASIICSVCLPLTVFLLWFLLLAFSLWLCLFLTMSLPVLLSCPASLCACCVCLSSLSISPCATVSLPIPHPPSTPLLSSPFLFLTQPFTPSFPRLFFLPPIQHSSTC